MRIHRLLAAALVALIVSVLGSITPPQAAAAGNVPITIALTAIVDEVYDPFQILGGTIHPGDTMTGSYTYNGAATDAVPSPDSGAYVHTTAPYGMSLKAGGHVFETDPQNVYFLISLSNNFYGHDIYLFYSANNRPLSDHIKISWFEWYLDDPTQTALKNTNLPKTAPKLSDWQQSVVEQEGLVVEGYADNAQYPNEPYPFRIRGHVTQAQKITR
jgi:hypothetical protein